MDKFHKRAKVIINQSSKKTEKDAEHSSSTSIGLKKSGEYLTQEKESEKNKKAQSIVTRTSGSTSYHPNSQILKVRARPLGMVIPSL